MQVLSTGLPGGESVPTVNLPTPTATLVSVLSHRPYRCTVHFGGAPPIIGFDPAVGLSLAVPATALGGGAARPAPIVNQLSVVGGGLAMVLHGGGRALVPVVGWGVLERLLLATY